MGRTAEVSGKNTLDEQADKTAHMAAGGSRDGQHSSAGRGSFPELEAY